MTGVAPESQTPPETQTQNKTKLVEPFCVQLMCVNALLKIGAWWFN
jgi:hypothetical protein